MASWPLRFLQERNVEALDLYSHTTPHLLRPAQLAEISTDIAQPLAAILVAPALADLGDDRTTRALRAASTSRSG